ncbi:MAG TPA: 4-(cytidine 5'-diphospho)-2-C-methyl-D-erythritol kinase [Anaeromyxobacteraceae bacterium]|nr:4-(cytidine 5'-diphospho)-2-C-methyl-D-erythritol kinase [Anaeromyxobacteraceae bacterium]
MLRLVARAPAKVNLVLRVGPRRPDGFHRILSLMVPLQLADLVRVGVRLGRPGPVSCRCPGRPDLDGPGNLAARAAEAFRDRFAVDDGVEVVIRKRIPVTAGLGGGSSDAAAVIRCLARAIRVRDRRALFEVAASVGSDVPFFLGSGPAWASGRGERLRAAQVPPLHLLLVHPRDPTLAIRAGDAYRWLDHTRSGMTLRTLRRPKRRFRPSDLANDLMAPCLDRLPRLAAVRGWLEGCGAAGGIMMSGSGPTFFAIFAGPSAARAAQRTLRQRAGGEAVDAIVTRTLRRLPGVSPWKSPRSVSSRSTKRS